MTALTWRSGSANDREELQRFQCTTRARRRGRTVYPKPWERAVETAVREVNPRGGNDSIVLIGRDNIGVAAVASVGVDREYPAHLIELVAVASRLRGQGGAIASEALDEAMQWALNRMDAARERAPMIVADLDPRNAAARRLAQRAGFQRLAVLPSREVWSYEPGVLPFDQPPK